ncbi:MAG TPA: hypothetical protein VGG06_19045 [Thermoanaerobaculia bacterium]|jgi:hypothetical protein
MTALSRQALRADKAIRDVTATLRENRDVLGDGVTQLLQPFAGEGQTVPGFSAVVDPMVNLLESLGRDVVLADQGKLDENAVDFVLRARRDAASAELYREIVALKGAVRSAHGPEGVKILGFAQELRPDPVLVERQAERLLANLGNPERPLPPARAAGTGIDSEAVRQSLTPKHAALQGVLRLLEGETKGTVTAQLTKNSTMADYRRMIVSLARTVEGLFRLIGRDDLADRIPTAVRRGIRRRREETPPPAQTTPPASEGGAPSS